MICIVVGPAAIGPAAAAETAVGLAVTATTGTAVWALAIAATTASAASMLSAALKNFRMKTPLIGRPVDRRSGDPNPPFVVDGDPFGATYDIARVRLVTDAEARGDLNPRVR